MVSKEFIVNEGLSSLFCSELNEIGERLGLSIFAVRDGRTTLLVDRILGVILRKSDNCGRL